MASPRSPGENPGTPVRHEGSFRSGDDDAGEQCQQEDARGRRRSGARGRILRTAPCSSWTTIRRTCSTCARGWRRHGYRFREARDGAQALSAIREAPAGPHPDGRGDAGPGRRGGVPHHQGQRGRGRLRLHPRHPDDGTAGGGEGGGAGAGRGRLPGEALRHAGAGRAGEVHAAAQGAAGRARREEPRAGPGQQGAGPQARGAAGAQPHGRRSPACPTAATSRSGWSEEFARVAALPLAAVAGDAGHRPLQAHQRHLRPPLRGRGAARGGAR